MTGGGTAVLRDLVLRVVERADERGVVPVTQAGHPVLRSVAVAYDGWLRDDELARLLEVMWATMHAAPGVGLAAPQVGLPVAIAVVADPGAVDPEVGAARERPRLAPRVLVNPTYAAVDEERVAFFEGCLSVQGYQAVVARPRRVRLRAVDADGGAVDEVLTGWPARIVQHETDHLHGVLYLDRAELRSLCATDGVGARWAGQPHPVAAAAAFGFPLPPGTPGA